MAGDPVFVSYGITVPGSDPVDGQFTLDRATWDRLTETQREELVDSMYAKEVHKIPGAVWGAWFLENADLDDPTL